METDAWGVSRVWWSVEARKLDGNDKQAVSPTFELVARDARVAFKIMLFPAAAAAGKGQSSFKKARGQGVVQLKCESDPLPAAVHFFVRISVGSAPLRGPVAHSFSRSAVCGLPAEMERFDFRAAVDRGNRMFTVCLELAPQLDRM